MSVYDRWRIVSWIIIVLIFWIEYGKVYRLTRAGAPPEEIEKWRLRKIGVTLTFWIGWATMDVIHHDWPFVVFDGFMLGWTLKQFHDWWRRNKQRKLAEWAGYKAEAIRAKMRLAFGGVG